VSAARLSRRETLASASRDANYSSAVAAAHTPIYINSAGHAVTVSSVDRYVRLPSRDRVKVKQTVDLNYHPSTSSSAPDLRMCKHPKLDAACGKISWEALIKSGERPQIANYVLLFIAPIERKQFYANLLDQDFKIF